MCLVARLPWRARKSLLDRFEVAEVQRRGKTSRTIELETEMKTDSKRFETLIGNNTLGRETAAGVPKPSSFLYAIFWSILFGYRSCNVMISAHTFDRQNEDTVENRLPSSYREVYKNIMLGYIHQASFFSWGYFVIVYHRTQWGSAV